MPRANIFIRKENEARWATIENKSGWVNDKLADKVKIPDIIKTPEQASEKAKRLQTVKKETKDAGFCPVHAIPFDNKGKCLQKGCKYA